MCSNYSSRPNYSSFLSSGLESAKEGFQFQSVGRRIVEQYSTLEKVRFGFQNLIKDCLVEREKVVTVGLLVDRCLTELSCSQDAIFVSEYLQCSLNVGNQPPKPVESDCPHTFGLF